MEDNSSFLFQSGISCYIFSFVSFICWCHIGPYSITIGPCIHLNRVQCAFKADYNARLFHSKIASNYKILIYEKFPYTIKNTHCKCIACLAGSKAKHAIYQFYSISSAVVLELHVKNRKT